MKQLNLIFLWFACATLFGLLLVSYFHSCAPSVEFWMPPPPMIPPLQAPLPPQKDGSAAQPKPVADERVQPPVAEPAPLRFHKSKMPDGAEAQTYTYVGPTAPPHGQTKPSERSENDVIAPDSPSAAPKPNIAADSTLAIAHAAYAEAATGDIPDLDLRLNGASLDGVIRRYGYLPAVKSRTRLLGKIAGEKFLPLAPKELAAYARRGRAGDRHPHAQRWLSRVAAELALPSRDLQFIFLVPHQTEALFIEAERLAIARAGKPANQVALIRAHFDSSLAIVVDELITKTGEPVAIDSVRLDGITSNRN
jgi:hypothetical protein